MTTNNDKQRIKFLFESRCELMDLSQAKAARMVGVNPGALSAVLTGKYQSDDTSVWKKIAIWVEYRASDWESAPTKNFMLIENTCDQAKLHSQVYAIVGPAGVGKSHALRHYATSHKNVIHLTCGDHWTKEEFLYQILNQMGKPYKGLTVSEMMKYIIKDILSLDNPLIILDEYDKLDDKIFIFLITLYNKLEDNCGIIVSATQHLVHRIERGIKYNKKGYAEIHSRLGHRPIQLNKISAKDVQLVCEANGIEDKIAIEKIVNDCDGDLRRVKRSVHRDKLTLMQED
jgi:DNA transposition AAA+ family ATPase